jgi:single-stranded DNA-binding protein
MAGDLNVFILTGQIITEPMKSKINYQRTAVTSFALQSNEHYIDSTSNKPAVYNSIIPIETLGRNAEYVGNNFHKGMRVYINGYIRTKPETGDFSVRTHAVKPEESFYSERYYEGMEHALDLLKCSRDKDAAVAALNTVLGSRYEN